MVMYSDVFFETYAAKTTAAKAKVIDVEYLNADLGMTIRFKKNPQGIISTFRSGQIGVGASTLLNGINSLNINTQPLVVWMAS